MIIPLHLLPVMGTMEGTPLPKEVTVLPLGFCLNLQGRETSLRQCQFLNIKFWQSTMERITDRQHYD